MIKRSGPTFTEQESLAIIEAERLGKPHPFPERDIGSPEWSAAQVRVVEARDAASEPTKVYQLAFWPDDKRAMPGDFIACALFSCLQGKDAEYVERQTLASVNGLSVSFTGRRLTQVHADVWEAIMHLSRQLPEGSLVKFRARQLLRLMGRQIGGKQRDDLDLWMNQLTATSVVIHDQQNAVRFRGSLLPRSVDHEQPDDTLYCVDINRDLAKVLSANLFLVDWEHRQLLQQKPLAAWLQRHFSRFTKPVTVGELYRLSGSTTKQLRDFRRQLRAALSDLQSVGVLASWRIDEATDTVHVTRVASEGTPARGLQGDSDSRHAKATPSPHALLPIGSVPVLTEETRKEFAALYPDKDVDHCLADFAAWLAKSGNTAKHPNKAFLGFAKGWKFKRAHSGS
jgi:hypothetical protein